MLAQKYSFIKILDYLQLAKGENPGLSGKHNGNDPDMLKILLRNATEERNRNFG